MFIDELYDLVEKNIDHIKVNREYLDLIRRRYRIIHGGYGAKVNALFRITSGNKSSQDYKCTNIMRAVKNSIREGELKTNDILKSVDLNK